MEYKVYDTLIICRLAGELLSEKAKEIEKYLSDLMKKGPEVIALDCANLTYIDSGMMAMFVSLLKKGLSKKIKLLLYDVPKEILEMMKMARLHTFLIIKSKAEFECEFNHFIEKGDRA